jgi:thioester reductase-like protein
MSERKIKNILLTGATGFLGSHLTARLLETGHHVTALVRGSKNASARDRLADVLRDVRTTPLHNLDVVEGDIALPALGLDEAAASRIASSTDEVWHCAASLSFQQEDRDEIFRMNVDGTRNVLEMVERTRTRRLQHVSTAYVAGNRLVGMEDEIDVGQTFRNPYEESKCRAEVLVTEAHRQGKATPSIYRPSIVIGDSKTGVATHFHCVYAFIRALWAVLERMRRRMAESGVVHLALRVPADESQTLNFVPIDYVVDGMIAIAQQPGSVGRTYHLANPVATENRMWLPHICRVLGVEGLQFVREESFRKTPKTKLEGFFQKQMAFYYQYLQGEPRFDCRNALGALRGTGIECPPMTPDFIDKMAGWYVNFLKVSR